MAGRLQVLRSCCQLWSAGNLVGYCKLFLLHEGRNTNKVNERTKVPSRYVFHKFVITKKKKENKKKLFSVVILGLTI